MALWSLLTRRGHQIQKLVEPMGLKPAGSDSPIEESKLLSAPLFTRDDARPEHVLAGEIRGFRAVAFEYAGPKGEPDPVAGFAVADRGLPTFELRPRLSSNDPRGLSFETNPRFGEIYALTGGDETALRRLFSAEVISFFERSENQDWGAVCKDGWLGITVWPLGERRHKLDPKQFAAFLEDAKQVLFVLANK